MYQYEYETLYVGGGFWMNNADCQHREIIDRRAAQGWRYVGYIPTRFSGEGGSKEIDLLVGLGALTACGGGNENGATGEEAEDQEEGYVPGGGLGYLGDTMHTYWFDFTVEDAYICQSYDSYTAAADMQLVVVTMAVQSTFLQSLPMSRYDFQIQWGGEGEDDYAWPIAAATEDQFPDEYSLGIHEERSGVLVYEVPADTVDFSVSFAEYFEDDTEGDVYFVYFTADTSGGAAV